MTIKKFLKLVSIAFFMLLLYSCAKGENETKQSQRHYEYSAESNMRLAEDYRNRGIEYMAEYHEDEAQKARHNQYAEDCGFIEFILFEVLFNGDACEHK